MQSKKILLVGSYSPERGNEPEKSTGIITGKDGYSRMKMLFRTGRTMFATSRNCRTKSIRGTTY